MDENLVTTAFLKIKEKWSTLCTMRPYTFLLRASFKGGPPLKEAEKKDIIHIEHTYTFYM